MGFLLSDRDKTTGHESTICGMLSTTLEISHAAVGSRNDWRRKTFHSHPNIRNRCMPPLDTRIILAIIWGLIISDLCSRHSFSSTTIVFARRVTAFSLGYVESFVPYTFGVCRVTSSITLFLAQKFAKRHDVELESSHRYSERVRPFKWKSALDLIVRTMNRNVTWRDVHWRNGKRGKRSHGHDERRNGRRMERQRSQSSKTLHIIPFEAKA